MGVVLLAAANYRYELIEAMLAYLPDWHQAGVRSTFRPN